MQRFWKRIALSTVPLILLFTFDVGGISAFGQDNEKSEEANDQKGFSLYEKLMGSSNPRGLTADTSVGYSFKYFGIDAGVPFTTTRATSATSSSRNNTVNNAYVDISLSPVLPLIDFSSVLTGFAPLGSRAKGVSTGRVTFDWTNHFGFSFWRFGPFGSAGISNTIADAHISPLIRNNRAALAFAKPYTTLGLLGNFEAGTNFKISKSITIGASMYDVLPHGQQKVFSRVIPASVAKVTAATTPQAGKAELAQPAAARKHRTPVAQVQAVAVGTADLTRDNGFSFYQTTTLHSVDINLGYVHSVPYASNVVTVGLGFDLWKLAKRGRNSAQPAAID